MVKLCACPGQNVVPLEIIGVTVILATKGNVPVLTMLNGFISPVPVASKPILGVSLVHSKIVPNSVDVNAIRFVKSVSQ